MRNVKILIAVIAALLLVVPAALAQVRPPVPNVAGMPLNIAQKALVSAGFNAVVTQENVADPNKNNIVLKQQVPPGTNLAKGSSVPVVVGRYTAPVQQPVPNVVGLPLAEAQTALSKAKLNAAVTMQPVDQPQRNNVVLAQNVPAGKTLPPGSMVPIVVGRYTAPAQQPVPNVVGMPLDKAQAALAQAKLNAQVTMQPVDQPQRNNVVLAQNVPVGKTLSPGSMVPVVVGKYTAPAQQPVPNVVGMPLDKAQAALAQAKLNAVVTMEKVTDKNKNSIVLKQQVAPGTALAPGSQVPLIVGRYEAPAKVPNVVGINWGEAKTSLTQAKLTPNFVSQSTSIKQKHNIVLEQSVRAGTEVAPGTKVDVFVGRYRTTAEMVREIQNRPHTNINQAIPADNVK
jgi:beta-lactam-binding protein with PASTA domain